MSVTLHLCGHMNFDVLPLPSICRCDMWRTDVDVVALQAEVVTAGLFSKFNHVVHSIHYTRDTIVLKSIYY